MSVAIFSVAQETHQENVNFFTTFSAAFMQCAPKATEFGEITQNKAHYAVQVIQGHRFW